MKYYIVMQYSNIQQHIIMTSINIYIPRILGSVKKTEVIEVFKHMDIGTVTNIDMIRKINENRNKYYYAFITIKLFDTTHSETFKTSLCKYNMIRLLYDEESAQYWEIKLKVDRAERSNMKDNKCVPFYRYDTLIGTNLDLKMEMLYEDYKPYNMWETTLMLQGVFAEL